MNLQARRKSGNQFTAEDVLEVVFDSNNIPMGLVTHTITVVSGPNVTHGGGGVAEEYLHYKALERDANDSGIIDYSNTVIKVAQEEKGTSVIKVVARTITKEKGEELDAILLAITDSTPNEGEVVEHPNADDYFESFESGEITLEWGDDTLV
jgi:hypothetical protein